MLVTRGIGRNGDTATGIVSGGLAEFPQEEKRGGRLSLRKGYASMSFVKRALDMASAPYVKNNEPVINDVRKNFTANERKSARVVSQQAFNDDATGKTLPSWALLLFEKLIVFKAYLFVDDFVAMRVRMLGQAIKDEAETLAAETQRLIQIAMDREEEDVLAVLCMA